MNDLVDYIKTHPDWRKKLVEKPFCLTIKDDGPYTIFTYSQIDSDFYNPIVKVSRGIILRVTETLTDNQSIPGIHGVYECNVKITCQAFSKFSNYGEGYADSIDWSGARVQEKIDGSLIKFWFDEGQWHISTNGMIDAFKCNLPMPTNDYKMFGDLVLAAEKNCKLDKSRLNVDYTYIFELVSPFNRIVVPYTEITLYHIGTRNIITGQERAIDIGVQKPKEYFFNTFDDVIAYAATLPFSEEGYVVVDKNWLRVKVKGKQYLQAHHMRSNDGTVNPSRVLEMIKGNEQEEFLSYFPEYKEHFDKIMDRYEDTIVQIFAIKDRARDIKARSATRKDFALEVLKMPEKLRKYYFAQYDEDDAKLKKMVEALDYEDLL